MMFFTLSETNNGRNAKALAILEVVVMIFITTFVPTLIDLGRPPENLPEIWSELWIAVLTAAYAYMRMRGIEPAAPPDD